MSSIALVASQTHPEASGKTVRQVYFQVEIWVNSFVCCGSKCCAASDKRHGNSNNYRQCIAIILLDMTGTTYTFYERKKQESGKKTRKRGRRFSQISSREGVEQRWKDMGCSNSSHNKPNKLPQMVTSTQHTPVEHARQPRSLAVQ